MRKASLALEMTRVLVCSFSRADRSLSMKNSSVLRLRAFAVAFSIEGFIRAHVSSFRMGLSFQTESLPNGLGHH